MIYITKIDKETVSDLVTLIALKSKAIELGSVWGFIASLKYEFIVFSEDGTRTLCQIDSDYPDICSEFEIRTNDGFASVIAANFPRKLTIENAVKAIELAITVKGLDEIVKCIPGDMVDSSEEIKDAIVRRVYSLDK